MPLVFKKMSVYKIISSSATVIFGIICSFLEKKPFHIKLNVSNSHLSLCNKLLQNLSGIQQSIFLKWLWVSHLGMGSSELDSVGKLCSACRSHWARLFIINQALVSSIALVLGPRLRGTQLLRAATQAPLWQWQIGKRQRARLRNAALWLSTCISQSASNGKAQRGREYPLPRVGELAKFHGKGHRYRRGWRIGANNLLYHTHQLNTRRVFQILN